MRRCGRRRGVGCELFEGMLTYLEAGLTETEVAATLEYAARLAGAEGMSVRDDCGEWRAIGAAAWPGDGGEVAEAGVRDAGFRCYSRRILQRYDAYRAHGQGDAG